MKFKGYNSEPTEDLHNQCKSFKTSWDKNLNVKI